MSAAPRRQLREDRRGNAMIEFALAFAMLFPVLAGTFQFGYAFYIYNTLETAVRAGARYASLRTYDSPSETPSDNYLSTVRNMVVYGDPNGGDTPVVPGLAPEHVTVDVTFVDGLPRKVTVGVDDYQANAVFRLLDFNTKPTVTMPYVGRFDPE